MGYDIILHIETEVKMKKNKPYLIAEIGVNFYDTAKALGITPLEAAKKYIDGAKEAGIDCAKFQSYKAKTIVSKNSPAYWDTTKEPTKTQYELFLKHDGFNEADYRELCEYTHSKGMDFTSTPFDYNSADYLYELVDFYKVSSSDLSNLPFIKHIALKGKPMVISVGAAYLSEVDEAIRTIKETGNNDITILHCVLSYPTAPENANLRIIETLKKTFPDVKVGFSDHVAPDETMMTLATAYLMGAEVIEKHFTLDKTLKGNDHYHSGDIEDFKKDSEKYFSMSNVKIAGFMTMAPFDASEYEIDNYFSKMRELKEEYEKKYDYITELSMGMSNDYIEALKNGATIIRIGSKLFE